MFMQNWIENGVGNFSVLFFGKGSFMLIIHIKVYIIIIFLFFFFFALPELLFLCLACLECNFDYIIRSGIILLHFLFFTSISRRLLSLLSLLSSFSKLQGKDRFQYCKQYNHITNNTPKLLFFLPAKKRW